MRKAETGEEKPRWAYDFVHIRTGNRRAVRLLTVIDEYTGDCLAIRAGRSIRAPDVIETLPGLMLVKGVPERICLDSGTEFTARAVREWLARVGAKTLYIKLRVSMGERIRGEFQR
jgi:transposase InsO family protein